MKKKRTIWHLTQWKKISANIQRERMEINKNDIQLKDNFYIKRKRRPFLFVYKRIVNNENDKN